MNKVWYYFLGLSCGLSMVSPLQAMVVYDPANYIQNKLSALNSAKMLLNQVKEVRYQLSMYHNDLRNMRHLPRKVWDNADSEVHELMSWQRRGSGVNYAQSNAVENFNQLFSLSSSSTNERQADLSNQAMATLKNAMAARLIHANQFRQEAREKAEFERIADHADGQTQLLQANHRLVAAQIGQMQKLRQLVLDQNNSQDVMYARELALDQARYEQHRQWLAHGAKALPSLGMSPGFGPENLTQGSN
jgi:type IV secretion system protein TrbJ